MALASTVKETGRLMATATIDTAIASAVKLGPDAPNLCLGSASSSRRAILAAALETKVDLIDSAVPDIDEQAIGDRAGGDAVSLTRRIAVAKADALLQDRSLVVRLKRSKTMMVTGDQVVTDGGSSGTIREKAVNAAETREFVSTYAAGAPCATVGALCVHDCVTGARVVATHVATVNFEPDWPDEDIDVIVQDPTIKHCAGALMIEHPRLAPHIKSIDGGIDSIMGLSTQTLAKLIAEVKKINECKGDMLYRTDLKRWAVIGDVLNEAKPAFRVAAAIANSGRELVRINPRDNSGTCYKTLTAAVEAVGPIDAVDLIITPKVGPKFIEEMAHLGIENVFMQPGADAPEVVKLAKELGIHYQQGCVLVSPPAKI